MAGKGRPRIVYSSDESGTQEVYVQDFPSSKGKWKISTAGGAEARWRRDGRELFYVAERTLMAVDVRLDGPTFQAGVPRVLFETSLDPGDLRRLARNRYVVSPDGQRFLMVISTTQADPTPVTVVVNWR